MKIITNGQIITPDGILEGYDLIIKDQLIDQLIKTELSQQMYETETIINAHGGYIAPGFIDIHADYIEHIASPRPTSLMDFGLALREAERELLTHGITTMFHSLSMYKTKQLDHKPIRQQDNVRKLIDIIAGTHTQKHLIRHRFHARFEMDNVESVDELKSYIKEDKIDLLSFMDHTPGQGQYRDIEGYKQMMKQYGHTMAHSDLDIMIKERIDNPKISVDTCMEIAQLAKKHHVAIASHDDDTIDKLNLIKTFGTSISEFPITLEVAKKAYEMGFYTVAGAPNILLGGSHSGNMAAHKAIEEGVIDILCSDYYPAALLHAVFKLHHDYGHDLADMFKLITLNPAKAVLMDHEIGSIEKGKRADLLIIEKVENDFPVVTSCFVDGAHVFQISYR